MVHIHNRIHKAVSVGFQDWCHFPTLTKLTLGAVYQKCELAMVHKELMQCVALACWVMAWSIQLTTPSRMWWCRHLHGSLDTTSSPLSCTGTVSLPVAPLLELWGMLVLFIKGREELRLPSNFQHVSRGEMWHFKIWRCGQPVPPLPFSSGRKKAKNDTSKNILTFVCTKFQHKISLRELEIVVLKLAA